MNNGSLARGGTARDTHRTERGEINDQWSEMVFITLCVALLSAALLVLACADPAHAAYNGRPSFGEKRVYLIYENTRYDSALRYAITQMRLENERFGGRGIAVRLTEDRGQADTVVYDSSHAKSCASFSRRSNKPDLIKFRPRCLDDPRRNPRRIALHEMMHSYGFGHVNVCSVVSFMDYHCAGQKYVKLKPYDHDLYRSAFVE